MNQSSTQFANKNTPWGKAQHATHLGMGVYHVSTASHGGIYVPMELTHHIPAERRAEAARWSGSERWYEEDCCWAYVADAMPELFKPADVEMARTLISGMAKHAS